MSDAEIISAMRRKAGVGRPPPEVQPMSPAKALTLALAKAAEETIGLVLQVIEVDEERIAMSRLAEEVPENALMTLLEGPENIYGLAVWDRNTVSAIVEQQTTGKVLTLPPEDRAPTATDAVMCSDICNQALRQFESIVAEMADPPDVAGFHAAAQLRETRSLVMAFDDVPYRLYRIRVRLGRGARDGVVFLVFPYDMPKPKASATETAEFGDNFQNVVMKSEACLDTVLHRLRMPLADVTALSEGMMLPIPREAISRVELRADDRLVSRARLGQINGKRALRLVLCSEEDEGLGETGGAMFGGAGVSAIGGFGGDASGGLSQEAETGLPDPSGFPALAGGEAASPEADLPPLGDLPATGDLPPLGQTGEAGNGDLPSLGDLPPIGDLPPLGEGFATPDELPPLE